MSKPARKKKPKSAIAEMTTAEAAVATLIGHGLDTVYALPGVHNDHLFDAFQRAEFWSLVQGTPYHLILNRTTLSSVSLTCFGGVSSDLPFRAIQVPPPGSEGQITRRLSTRRSVGGKP